MLKQMRGFTRSWAARGLLLVLAVLMSITITQGRFDVMRILSSIGGPRGLADVGNYDISPHELTRELDIALRYQRQQGQTITKQQAIQQGFHLQLLDSLISRHALQEYAEKLGIHVGVMQVADAIRQMPAARGGLNGGFDQQTYSQFLRELGYSPVEFETEQRGALEMNLMMQALTAGIRAPASFGKLALAFDSETRVVSMAEAPGALVGNIPDPDATQLQAFYEDNRDAFRVPEYRAVTLVYARVADFAARITVPEDQLRHEFESRRGALTQPERRSFTRFAATTQQQAQDIVARLGRGETPDAIAHALNIQMVHTANETKDHVADHAVAEAVFTTPPGAPPRAVPAQLTPWAVVKVEAITPAVEPNFEHERDGLRDQIARDQATDQLNDAEQAFVDARSGGASVAEAARAHGLSVVTVPAVDARGLTPQGQPAQPFVDQAEMLTTAFHTDEGEASDFTPAGDADVVVAVDHITPATVKSLADVRAQLIPAWIARERVKRLTQLGTDIAADVAHGRSFADVVRARHLEVRVTSQPLDRQTASRLPARNLAAEIFAAAPGAVVSDARADGASLLVANVEAIRRADPATQREAVEQARTQAQQQLGSSLFDAISADAVAAAHVRRNQPLITSTFAPQPGDENAPAGQ